MEFETVKVCFKKYITHMETVEKILSPEKYSVETMSVQDIDRITQIVFMEYIIKCGDDKINQLNRTCTLYKHLNTLIRQYIQDDTNKTSTQLRNDISKLQEENIKFKKDLSIPIIKQATPNAKGWFF